MTFIQREAEKEKARCETHNGLQCVYRNALAAFLEVYRNALTAFLENTPGSDLLSHTPAHAVPSAVAGLTSVFGMGTGVTLPL
jgi:hypothetical protein